MPTRPLSPIANPRGPTPQPSTGVYPLRLVRDVFESDGGDEKQWNGSRPDPGGIFTSGKRRRCVRTCLLTAMTIPQPRPSAAAAITAKS